jgi:molecular chaperone GrpE
MSRRLPYRRPTRQEVVPRELAERLAQDRDALAAQLRRAQGELAHQQRVLQAREEERANLLETVRALEHQVQALHRRQPEPAPVGPDPQQQARIAELTAQLQQARADSEHHLTELAAERARREAAEAACRRAEAQKAELAAEQPDSARAQRLAADLANLRRRREEDIQSRVRGERRSVLQGMLEVRDSLSRALDASVDRTSPWHQGTAGIRQQLDEVLRRQGVHRLGEVGEQFDPACHEAIGVAAAAGSEVGRVVQVERHGFAFDDGELIRPAQVIVSKEES